jgi:hypothetical protein
MSAEPHNFDAAPGKNFYAAPAAPAPFVYDNSITTVCDIFNNTPVLNIKYEAGAASRYGSCSTKMMRLLAAPAPQH